MLTESRDTGYQWDDKTAQLLTILRTAGAELFRSWNVTITSSGRFRSPNSVLEALCALGEHLQTNLFEAGVGGGHHKSLAEAAEELEHALLEFQPRFTAQEIHHNIQTGR